MLNDIKNKNKENYADNHVYQILSPFSKNHYTHTFDSTAPVKPFILPNNLESPFGKLPQVFDPIVGHKMKKTNTFVPIDVSIQH